MNKKDVEDVLKKYGLYNTLCALDDFKRHGCLCINGAGFMYFEPKKLTEIQRKQKKTEYALKMMRISSGTIKPIKSLSINCATQKELCEYFEMHGYRKATEGEKEQIELLKKQREQEELAKDNRKKLMEMAQKYYEEHFGTREDFVREFGKSYL